MSDQPGLITLLDSIRAHLDALTTAPLSDNDLAHLAAIDEWLADLVHAPEEGQADDA